MTAFWVHGVYYELTLYMDLWNNEIVAHALSSKRGDRMTYISGLNDLIELKKQHPEYRMVLHSDYTEVLLCGLKYHLSVKMFGIVFYTRSTKRRCFRYG